MFLEERFLEKGVEPFHTRVLHVQLTPASPGTKSGGTAYSRIERWTSADIVLERIGALGGSALALALCLEAVRDERDAGALYLAVGSAVRAGLPTAARATVAGISPLTGAYVDGQVGGGFAARLVALADALVLRGSLGAARGQVLVIDRLGRARLETHPALELMSTPERAAYLLAAHPEVRGLCVGAAGDAGVPFANLATLADPPSFTGRGGLGALLGRAGLCALLVEGDDRAEPETTSSWAEALAQSPHLRARGAGGTFELMAAFAARGDLPADPAASADYSNRLAQRQSCPGCPTACRHVLQVGAKRIAGRFSATFPFGESLGVRAASGALDLLQACNDVGVDSAEMGATLAVLDEARARGLAPGPRLKSDLNALRAAILDVQSEAHALGCQALADSVGDSSLARAASGSSVRQVSDLAALLGQCVSSRGSDPMRAFPFLAENGGDEQRLAHLVAPLVLPAGTFDSKNPAGKGRLVWWHENLANALDASGFCAFSAAGLIGDGFADLDKLAEWLALPGLAAHGQALLAAGASLALLQREIAERLGRRAGAELPTWARGHLDRPGMWDEYRVLRGLDSDGRVTPAARAQLGELALAQWGQSELSHVENFPGTPPATDQDSAPRRAGRLELVASGTLAAVLERQGELELELPATIKSAWAELVRRHPALEPWLGRDGDAAVSAYRAGQRLASWDRVHDGDRLELVVAISGG